VNARLELETKLRAMRGAWKQPDPALHYRGPADFVLRHGRWFGPVPYPEHAPWGSWPLNQCFGTAIFLAARFNLRCFEGYALLGTLIRDNKSGAVYHLVGGEKSLLHHAWNVDGAGRLIDATWNNDALLYFGVEFSVERADDATWNGDASVLDDYKRGWPLLKYRWHGESKDLAWPPSDRIELMRNPPADAGKWKREDIEARLGL
jgi:hypothetical protein